MGDQANREGANAHHHRDTPLPKLVLYDTEKAIRHVTVRQMLEAERVHSTALFRIEKREFNNVILVANISSFRTCDTYTDFELDDGTGRIRAQQWNSGLDDGAEHNQLDVDLVDAFPYVRVVGALEQYMDKKLIKVLRMTLALSPYEPYHHSLQAICDTLTYERGPPPQPADQKNQPTDSFWGDGMSALLAPKPNSTPKHVLQAPHFTLRDDGIYQDESKLLTPVLTSKGEGKADVHLSEPAGVDDNSDQLEGKSSASTSYSSPSRPRDFTRRDLRTSVTPKKKDSRWFDSRSRSPSVESPPPSSPLLWSLAPSIQHQPRRSSTHDPYSHLSSLQRDIILCIASARAESAQRQGIYPSMEGVSVEDSWEGVHVSVIIRTVSVRRPTLTPDTFLDSVEILIEEGYIFCTIDDSHYNCV
ncbi:hypothetical protein FPV67DRAFT_17657 [Lyophyllum atratum]|nr:hypothetical protein FPV67DRAFT_17657 [Lyophyllum atratum]